MKTRFVMPIMLACVLPAAAQDAQSMAQRRAEQEASRTEVPADQASLERYAGNYQLQPDVVLNIRHIDDHLEARRNGQTLARLYAESERKFFFKTVHAQISFVPDGSGTVNELVLHQGGNERHAPRIAEDQAQAELKRINSSKVFRGNFGMGLGLDSSMPRGLMGMNQR